MKRFGNLYDRIAEPDNVRLAFWKAAKGKYDRQEVKLFRVDFTANIEKLCNQLHDSTPDIGHYRFFHVYDPKPRNICAASFPERVLHHAVMNICEPFLDSYAIYDSYACRKGKGLRKAITRAHNFMNNNVWFLKLDIAKYFDSIDQAVMLELLSGRFKDRRLLDLFRKLLATYSTTPNRGVPIGNLISQHFANHYLSVFDHWIKEELRIKYYLRYMDDFLLFSNDPQLLKNTLIQITIFLENRLSLKLKHDVQLNRCTHGVRFLGYRFLPGKILLSSRSKIRFTQKFRQYEQNYLAGTWDENNLAKHIEPLVDFTRAAMANGFRNQVFARYGALS